MIAAGFGFRASARVESLSDAFDRACAALPEGRAVDLMTTAADKAQADVFRAFAARRGIAARGVDAARLSTQKTRTRSDASLAARGTGSLSEAAALAALAEGGRLLGARVISEDGLATCALAEGDTE